MLKKGDSLGDITNKWLYNIQKSNWRKYTIDYFNVMSTLVGLFHTQIKAGPVDWSCISVEWFDSPNECPVYDIKQPDGEVPE